MSFVMGNDTNYKQKFYKPLLKRPSAGSNNESIKKPNIHYGNTSGVIHVCDQV